MKKRVQINGKKLREARELRALTQEQLSERAHLGVRTVRRLEAGEGSLEAVRRVTEALNISPEETLERDVIACVRDSLCVDPLVLEFGRGLVAMDTVIQPLMLRIVEMRRRLARELGLILPGVRFRDNLDLSARAYRVLLRTHCYFLGEAGEDPVEDLVSRLEACVRQHVELLLGVQDVQVLLRELRQPALVEAVIPHRLDLPGLTAMLRKLLAQGQSIRDLGWILEMLGQHPLPLPEPEALAHWVRGELVALQRRIEEKGVPWG